jgi:hypothetical protein
MKVYCSSTKCRYCNDVAECEAVKIELIENHKDILYCVNYEELD